VGFFFPFTPKEKTMSTKNQRDMFDDPDIIPLYGMKPKKGVCPYCNQRLPKSRTADLEKRKKLTLEGAGVMLAQDLPLMVRADDPQTSYTSAVLNQRTRVSQRSRLLVAFCIRGEATADEVLADTGIPESGGSTRISELHALGLIEPTGETRETSLGGTGRVYRSVVDLR